MKTKIDKSPLIRGFLTDDPDMPVNIKMSVALAEFLVALLRNKRHWKLNSFKELYLDILEQLLAAHAKESTSI